MNYIHHIGLTPPQENISINNSTIIYTPVLKVEYNYNNSNQDIEEFLIRKPIIIIMSKNAVVGLKEWMQSYNIDSYFFKNIEFWTIGERTHIYLKNLLNISSTYPSVMTGNGILKRLGKYKISTVLLIAGENIRDDFIRGLYILNINYFHFSVYTVTKFINNQLISSFKDNDNDYIVATSPSSVYGLLNNLAINNLNNLNCNIISIGPTTSKSIYDNGGKVFYESPFQNISILYENLKNIIEK